MAKYFSIIGMSVFFIFALLPLSFSEQLTITTYYPSPVGVYNDLQAYKLAVGDTDGDGQLNSADLPANNNDFLVAGKVGIGTTDPGTRLDVAADDITRTAIDARSLSFAGGTNVGISAKADNAPTVGPSPNNIAGVFDSPEWAIFVPRGDIYTLGNIWLGDSSRTLGIAGNVGIGTTTPGWLLHVNGDAAKPGGGTWTDSSDIRLKKNVKPLGGALKKMLQLRGITFRWREPEKHGNLTGIQMGMIGQEVEKVFPQWVGSDKYGYKDLTFRGFEALTVEAIRELKAENEALKKRIEALEQRKKF